jgi:hypothetical protein
MILQKKYFEHTFLTVQYIILFCTESRIYSYTVADIQTFQQIRKTRALKKECIFTLFNFSTELFRMVPTSRINSEMSWFIFNLRKKINRLVAHPVHNYCILSTDKFKQFMNLLYHIHTYWSSYPMQHPANASISALTWGKTEPPSPCLNMLPTWFYLPWPTQQYVVSPNGSCLQLLWGLCTFIQVNTMGEHHKMTNRHIYDSQLLFLTLGKISWPRIHV